MWMCKAGVRSWRAIFNDQQLSFSVPRTMQADGGRARASGPPIEGTTQVKISIYEVVSFL